MASTFDSGDTDRFLSAALSRGLLDGNQAETIKRESVARSVTAARWAIESGVLKPVEAEIAEAFSAPKDLAPGYELLDVLGYGALGVVYRAHQPHLKRDVAIKAILQSRLVEQNVAARFQQEGAAIGRLQHPNIVSAFDSGSHRERLFLVMELVRGTDLRERLDRVGPIDLATSLSIVRQTALGLAHALDQGIIHRDIKPGNLILTDAPAGFDLPEGVPLVKIADFGLARLAAPADSGEEATRLTLTGAALGTPMYCAPEQLSGDAVDHRADIYALGATWVNMLSGRPPLTESKISKLIAAKLTGARYDPDALPKHVPGRVRRLIDQMMAPDPEDRISDHGELIGRLDGLHGSSVGPTARVPRATLAARMPWLRWALAAGLLVGVVAVFAFSQGYLSRDVEPTLEESNSMKYLFQDLTAWTTRGEWARLGPDDIERVGAIRCSDRASILLPTLTPVNGEVASTFGMSVAIELWQASAAEIHFGFENNDLQTAPRYLLRLEQDRVRLGKQAGTGYDTRWISEIDKPTTPVSDQKPIYYQLSVERHEDRWYAYYGDREVGQVHLNRQSVNRLVQIIARDGIIHLDEARCYNLRPKPESD